MPAPAGVLPMLVLQVLLVQVLLVRTATGQTTDPTPGACDSEEARAFDFWVGDWSIRQTMRQADGSWIDLPAETSVERALDGCALVERWSGEVQYFWDNMDAPVPLRGFSVRAYHPESGLWRIHWMDTREPFFGAPYEGGFEAGRGTFYRENADGLRGARITFEPVAPDTVDWELAVSNDGENWMPIWRMAMSRRGE